MLEEDEVDSIINEDVEENEKEDDDDEVVVE